MFKKLLASLTLSLSLPVLADNHHEPSPSFSVSEVKPGLVLLQGKGGNILVSKGEDGLLLVDSDYSAMSEALQATLAELGGPVKYLLNTHWHGDHTQGNLVIGKESHIVAHENVRKRLNSIQEVKLFKMVSEPYPKHALPTITFNNKLSIHFNDQTISALHQAGAHTDGDSVIHFKEANLYHMGDMFFNGFYPFVDLEAGGSVLGMANRLSSLLKTMPDDATLIPGHGPVATKQELIAFRNMLVGTSKEVDKMLKAGDSLAEIQFKGLSSQWDEWEDGFLSEKIWIQIVYSSLLK